MLERNKGERARGRERGGGGEGGRVMLMCPSPLSCSPIVQYIDKQFESYLQEELKIKRDLVACHDTRVHVCLYFVSPTGHS